MKKIVMFSFLLIGITGVSFASELNKENPIKKERKSTSKKIAKKALKPIILTTWEPGSFSAGIFGCWGNGVCRRDVIINSGKSVQVEQGENVEATTEVMNNYDGTVTIKFLNNSMNKKNQDYYSNRETFILEEDFAFTDEELKALELRSGITLKKGSYNISKLKGVLSVTIKI